MSIENTLERIAVALERISSTVVEQKPKAASAAPVPAPTAPAAPAAPAAPIGSAAPAIPGAPLPAPVPATAPLQGVPTLDDIRAAFNDFHRSYPARVQEAYAIVLANGVNKLEDLPPATYPDVLKRIKSLVGD